MATFSITEPQKDAAKQLLAAMNELADPDLAANAVEKAQTRVAQSYMTLANECANNPSLLKQAVLDNLSGFLNLSRPAVEESLAGLESALSVA